MKRDLLNMKTPEQERQMDLASKIARTRKKAEKHQLVTLLCASLAQMTEKPKYRRPL